MSNLRRTISQITKKALPGVVISFVGDRVDVSVGGHIRRNCLLVGGPATVGGAVLVDDSSGRPVAYSYSEKAETAVAQTGSPTRSLAVDPDVPGGNSVSSSAVKVSADDIAAGYLSDKLVAGTNITLNVLNGGSNESIEIVASSGSGGGPGGGAPTDAQYVVAAAHGDLTSEIVIPGIAAHPDRKGTMATFNEEFDGSDPFTWDFTPTVHNVNSTIPSHLYLEAASGNYQGRMDFAAGTGNFDIRAKISAGWKGDGLAACIMGIMVSNAADTVAARWCFTKADNTAVTTSNLAYYYRNGGAWTASGGTASVQTYWYIRITRTAAGVLNTWWSPDGITWRQYTTGFSLAIDIAKVGVFFGATARTNVVAFGAIDWLRGSIG